MLRSLLRIFHSTNKGTASNNKIFCLTLQMNIQKSANILTQPVEKHFETFPEQKSRKVYFCTVQRKTVTLSPDKHFKEELTVDMSPLRGYRKSEETRPHWPHKQ